jgi:ATP adenylyltransferase
MPLERLYAAWRIQYVESATAADRAGGDASCVFCRLASEPSDPATGVVYEAEESFVVLNAFPYGSGHILVLPRRHVAAVQDLTATESASLWASTTKAIAAVEAAYQPDGMNLGANLGRAAGAGIPAHLHLHVLPRWSGDTNFMTAVAETRVIPEPLEVAFEKLRGAFQAIG